MDENKYLELIHRDLDGELSAEESAALRNYLDGNAEARRLHEELKDLNSTLGRAEEFAPPSSLRTDIMNALPEGRYAPAVAEKKGFLTLLRRMLEPGRGNQMPLVFAFGLIVGAVATLTLYFGVFGGPTLSERDVVGTVYEKDSLDGYQTLSTEHITWGAVNGIVQTRRRGANLIAEFSLQAPKEIGFQLIGANSTSIPDSAALPVNLLSLNYDEGTLQFETLRSVHVDEMDALPQSLAKAMLRFRGYIAFQAMFSAQQVDAAPLVLSLSNSSIAKAHSTTLAVEIPH